MTENTEEKFLFTVEGESLSLDERNPTARRIIELAQEKGIVPAQDQVEKLTLKGESGVTYRGGDIVNLLEDKIFSIGLAVYEFKVNGQKLESNLEKLVALDIIKMAQEKGAAPPGNAESLLLSAVNDGPEFKAGEWVDLSQFSEFLLQPNTSTPVA